MVEREIDYWFLCETCCEYHVPSQPVGMGGIGNLCEHCHEYTVDKEEKENAALEKGDE